MIGTLHAYLLEYSRTADDERRCQIESEIWQQFGAERTVMVLDMSGFSLMTRRHGIIHYLSMIRRMQETVRPIVNEHGGMVVKFEADNAFAELPHPEAGIRAAVDINRAAKRDNVGYVTEFGIHLSIGIDHGRILLAKGDDFFGDAVNTASKLGEDLAKPGEILVSQTAIDLLPKDVKPSGRNVKHSISGITVKALSIDY